MKRSFALALALALTLAVTACNETAPDSREAPGIMPEAPAPAPEETTGPADYPAAIMVDGVVYLMSYIELAAVDESAVIGYTTSYTDTYPSKNGETNFDRTPNMPYAVHEDGIALLTQDRWQLFQAKE